MRARLAILGVVFSLALGTVSVLWAGLNCPPPLWVLKYGLPGSQQPTGKTVTVEGVTFIMISPGYFRMGSDLYTWGKTHELLDLDSVTTTAMRVSSRGDFLGRAAQPVGLSWGKAVIPAEEMPVHWVQFPHGFGIARTEVTNAQYERFRPDYSWVYTANDPRPCREESKDDSDPAVWVSWYSARKYCKWLSRKSGFDVRLPSESEWECACRAGTLTKFFFGNDASELSEYAWWNGNWSLSNTSRVETRRPNAWGLYDMEGNAADWCQDTWHASYLLTREVREHDGAVGTEEVARAPDDGSAWVEGDSDERVVRGGRWGSCDYLSASRSSEPPDYRSVQCGVRPVLECGSGASTRTSKHGGGGCNPNRGTARSRPDPNGGNQLSR